MRVLLFPCLLLPVSPVLLLSSISRPLFPPFLPLFLSKKALFFSLCESPFSSSTGLNSLVFVMFGNDCPPRMWMTGWKGKNVEFFQHTKHFYWRPNIVFYISPLPLQKKIKEEEFHCCLAGPLIVYFNNTMLKLCIFLFSFASRFCLNMKTWPLPVEQPRKTQFTVTWQWHQDWQAPLSDKLKSVGCRWKKSILSFKFLPQSKLSSLIIPLFATVKPSQPRNVESIPACTSLTQGY